MSMIEQSGSITDGDQPASPARRAKTTIERYFGASVQNEIFSGDSVRRTEELAALYARVFNEVPDIEQKWTTDTAMQLVKDRMQRPGSMIVLMDSYSGKNKIVGAFFARIVPGHEGMNLTEPDVLIAQECRGLKLGNDVGWLGRAHADQLCDAAGETLQMNVSQTYRIPRFPREMWERHGYKLEDSFIQYSHDLLERRSPPAPRNVTIRPVRADDIIALAHF